MPELVTIDYEKLEKAILEEMDDFSDSRVHPLFPKGEEMKFISIKPEKIKILKELYNDVQNIIKKYSDPDFWMNELEDDLE